MSRARFDRATCDALAQCVKEIEAETDAEVVIAVRARSGSYLHADYLCGALVSFISLLFILFLPWTFEPYWVILDVLLFFAAGAFLSSRSEWLRRVLTSKRQRAEAVRTGAAAMFYEAGVANTAAEMGLLIYFSLLERRLEVIADRGVMSATPPLKWNDCLFALHQAGRESRPESLTAALRGLGSVLKEHLPATGENPNELPDAPRLNLK